MTKDEIIDYVLNSPENTNPNVLKGMLEQLDNGSGENIIHLEDTNGQLNYTQAEILGFLREGKPIVMSYNSANYYIFSCYDGPDPAEGKYFIDLREYTNYEEISYKCNNINDFPIKN